MPRVRSTHDLVQEGEPGFNSRHAGLTLVRCIDLIGRYQSVDPCVCPWVIEDDGRRPGIRHRDAGVKASAQEDYQADANQKS